MLKIPKRIMTINLDQTLMDYIKERAEREGRSVSNCIRHILRKEQKTSGEDQKEERRATIEV